MDSSLFGRSRQLARGLRRTAASKRSRVAADRRIRLAIDQLEQRLALAITTPLTIGGTSVGNFLDAPTGLGSLGDYVTVSVQGTRGTAIFNGGAGVADGGTIESIQIVNPSPDFQLIVSAAVRTGNAVPYGSDGIVQLGRITATAPIQGINTIRGPLTNVAVTTSPPIGFTQATPGSDTLTLVGNYASTFNGQFVAASPLLPTAAGTGGVTPTFATASASYDGGTNLTTVVLSGTTTASGTTAGALTLAEAVRPLFELTSFVGTSFSPSNADNGGLFVDRVLGADTVVNGVNYPDLGILVSRAFNPSTTIGIRDSLDARVVLGTSSSATVAGRMFVESATEASVLQIGTRTVTNWVNSQFQLTGGQGEFNARVISEQPFDGVVNLPGSGTRSWLFNRGVGPNAVLNAGSWFGISGTAPQGVTVVGNFAGKINSLTNGMVLSVTGNMLPTSRVNSDSDITLKVGGSVQQGAVISADDDISLDVTGNLLGRIVGSDVSGTVRGNVSGAIINASSDIDLTVTGSVLNSTLTADDEVTLEVIKGGIQNSKLQASEDDMNVDVLAGSVDRSSFVVGDEDDLFFFVKGNLTNSSVRASSDIFAEVGGNVSNTQFITTSSDISLDVGGSITGSSLIAGDDISLAVARDATNVTLASDAGDLDLDVGRNFGGTVQTGGGRTVVKVLGSVLTGSAITSSGDVRVDVTRNFDAAVTADRLRFFVGGNVSAASRITANTVTDWQGSGTPNFGIGGAFDGIINVGSFDAAPNVETVTVIGGGAGQGARFNVGRFFTDNLVFRGNYAGNLRVLQDLEANLDFRGNVNFITVAGRIGTYLAGSTPTGQLTSINVVGRLSRLNSNSFFLPTVAGKSGAFYNDSTAAGSLSSTGTLTTGSYGVVTPLRPPVQPTPPTPPAQTYTVPGTPTGFGATRTGSFPGPYGITVSFGAPTNGGLPEFTYEYTTDNGTTWLPLSAAGALPGPSNGGSFTSGSTYNVAVRAKNALGAGLPTGNESITMPSSI